MGLNIVQKVISSHLDSGDPTPGQLVSLRISQVLAHDLTGPLVLTHFEQLGVKKILCDQAAFYVDHQTTPTCPEVIERHQYLRSAAFLYGACYSRPGNGVSHYVHLERMAVPGRTLLGAAGHTQTLGAVGMLAMASDAVEAAAAMAGEPYRLRVPEVIRVRLHGRPRPFVSPKDIALELVRRRGTSGLAGLAIEFDGPGVRGLGVYERATIANMGTVLGAVTTIFPSDEKTKIFLQRQRRSKSWRRLEADPDAVYRHTEDVDLGALEPLALCSPPPGEVKPVREVQGRAVQEVVIGSCSNASIRDLLAVACMMKGKKVHPDCNLSVSPGSRQTLEVLARGEGGDGGSLADLVSAGVRVLEPACGPCDIPSCVQPDKASVRTFAHLNPDEDEARVYVVSPETAVACAIHGEMTDPRKLRRPPKVKISRQLPVDDSMIIKPHRRGLDSEITMLADPPMIPEPTTLEGDLRTHVIRRLGHGARLDHLDDGDAFTGDAGHEADTSCCFVAGQDLRYGQITADAALNHRRKGLRVVIAESFSPPCDISLAHAGVVPLTFVGEGDPELIGVGDELTLVDLARNLRDGQPIPVTVAGDGVELGVVCDLDERTRKVLISGGLLGFLRKGRDRARAQRG
jgi:aconitate hydratase